MFSGKRQVIDILFGPVKYTTCDIIMIRFDTNICNVQTP